MSEDLTNSIEEIIKADGRYPMAAVHFVRQGLSYAVKKRHPNATRSEERRVGKECRSRGSPYH